MAQSRGGQLSHNRNNVYRTEAGRMRTAQSRYVYGSAAPAFDVGVLEEPLKKKPSHVTRKNREKARHMNLGYVVFLVGALIVCGIVLMNYVQLQSELTARMQTVASLESDINTLKLLNDDEYNRLTSSIDLEEIKRIAIGELGMVYAGEGQIISYTNEGSDYMRRVAGEAD